MVLIQYIIIRKDLKDVLKWPLGAIIAQACHASTSCLWKFKEEKNVKDYLDDINNMHKVVLGVKDEQEILELNESLQKSGFLFHLWNEMPENIPSSIALIPYEKEHVNSVLGHLKLLR